MQQRTWQTKSLIVLGCLCLAGLGCAFVNSLLSPPTPTPTPTPEPTATPRAPLVALEPTGKPKNCDIEILEGGTVPSENILILKPGTRYTGELAQGAIQKFIFEAKTGDLISLRVTPKSGLEATVTLRTPGGREYEGLSIKKGSDDAKGEVYYLDVGGRYQIVMEGAKTGEYEILVETPTSARQLTAGDECENQFSTSGYKLYALLGKANVPLRIEVKPQPGLDVSFMIYGPKGFITQQDAGGGGVLERFTVVPEKDGVFMLWLNDDGASGGTFTLKIE